MGNADNYKGVNYNKDIFAAIFTGCREPSGGEGGITQLTHNFLTTSQVAPTSPRRHDIAATSVQRCYDVVCLLG